MAKTTESPARVPGGVPFTLADIAHQSKVCEQQGITREKHAKDLGISVGLLDELLKMAEENPDVSWHAGRLLADAREEAQKECDPECLYDFVLPSGKRLGDATKADVLEAAEICRQRGADAMFMRRLLENRLKQAERSE